MNLGSHGSWNKNRRDWQSRPILPLFENCENFKYVPNYEQYLMGHKLSI